MELLMPFQSEKQRKYLWANEPEIARDWTEKYGSRVKKANGGIGELLKFGGVGNMFAPASINAIYPAAADYNYGKGLQNYDTSGGYLSNARHAAAAATMRDELGGGIMGGIGANALGVLNELSGLARGVVAEGHELIGGPKHSFINTLGQTGEDLYANLYGSLYGKSGGAEDVYADMMNQLSANKGTGFKGFLEQGLAAQAEANKKYTPNTLTLADLISKTPNKVTAMGPNYNYGSAEAAGIPINKFQRSGNYPQSQDLEAQASGMFEEEDENGNWFSRYLNPRNIAQGVGSYIGNKISGFNPLTIGFNAMRGKMPYRGATGSAGGYSPAQLNRMNALGGYYSEPARDARRTQSRIDNMMARKAAGKSYSQKNLNKLTMNQGPAGQNGGNNGGNQGGGGFGKGNDPGGGAAGSPFNRGGLASLWQR